MPVLTITPPELHTGQIAIYRNPARFLVVAAGRRFGKSMLASVLCLRCAVRGGRAWWVFPTYVMARIGWRAIKRLVVQIPDAEVREGDKIVTLPGGGTIEVRSADNPDSLRGEGLDLCVMDECAFIREEAWTEGIRPALSDRLGRAMFISTPKGRNWFWRLYQRGQGTDPAYQSWRLPTVANPYIPASEIEDARQQLPELVFRQEYLAEFIDDAGGVFRRILEAATAERITEAVPGHEYVIGVDWGKLNDFTVLTVIDTTTSSAVYMDRFNQIDYSTQIGRLQGLCDRFRPQSIIAEKNSIGEPLIESLLGRGLPVQAFTTTNSSKQNIVDGLALAFEQSALRIIPDPVLIAELQSYEAERLPGGLIRYSAPAGLHDDCVMSLAMAWQQVNGYSPLFL